MNRLAGRNVLVTGGSSGIGQAIAVRFADEGANIAINYRKTPNEAEETEALVKRACDAVKESGCKNIIVGADVSDEEQVKEMFSQVINEWGRLDILINNAGIQKAAPSAQMTIEDFDQVLSVNLRGAFLCAREALDHFIKRRDGGVIINNSSVHEMIPKPDFIGYSVSKGGMGNMTKTLALEYAGDGIRVNAIGPGAIVTPINKSWIDDPSKKESVESHIPMGRAGTSEEIAAVAAFLASDDASYITGQTIYACGGLTLYPDFRTAWSSE